MRTHNIHIAESYKVSKRDIPAIVRSHIRQLPQGCPLRNRSIRSLCLEWYAHNFLYNLHICRSRTRSVDLNAPQRLWETVGYAVVGSIGYVFLK